ncbi:MAG: hypothetical protein KDB18_11400, partial [Salinibacterium sp.]|nr:hypothetical protein [Salinibacterium sp.]
VGLFAASLLQVLLQVLLRAGWTSSRSWLPPTVAYLLATPLAWAVSVAALGLGWDAPGLALFAALGAVVWLAELLESGLAGERATGLLALGLGALLVLTPLGIDEALVRRADTASHRDLVEGVFQLSPPVLLAPRVLGHDLFKQKELYRHFRVGEQLVVTPATGAGTRSLARLAGLLGGLAVLAAVGRALWRRRASARMVVPVNPS